MTYILNFAAGLLTACVSPLQTTVLKRRRDGSSNHEARNVRHIRQEIGPTFVSNLTSATQRLSDSSSGIIIPSSHHPISEKETNRNGILWNCMGLWSPTKSSKFQISLGIIIYHNRISTWNINMLKPPTSHAFDCSQSAWSKRWFLRSKSLGGSAKQTFRTRRSRSDPCLHWGDREWTQSTWTPWKSSWCLSGSRGTSDLGLCPKFWR